MLIQEQPLSSLSSLFPALQVEDSSADGQTGHFSMSFLGFFTHKQNPTFYFPIKAKYLLYFC